MAKLKKEDVEGAVNVNDDITPITRQPIDQVSADEWSTASVAELQAQLATLSRRAQMAAEIGNHSMLIQLNRGITRLKAIVKSKSNDDVGLI
jgi:hypothetical protein